MKKQVTITRKSQEASIPVSIPANLQVTLQNINLGNTLNVVLDTSLDTSLDANLDTKLYTKLILTNSILLIDTSYWVYYRFFALRNWYKRAFPDKDTDNSTYNWLEDTVFMQKYEKLFLDGISTICNEWRVPTCNVVFCIDCPYRSIWRYELNNNYKGTRLDSHKRNGFNSFAIFDIVKKDIIPKLIKKYSMNSILVDKCEADDIVGTLSVFLNSKLYSDGDGDDDDDGDNGDGDDDGGDDGDDGGNKNDCSNDDSGNNIKNKLNICILASDNDYIQVCCDNIILIDGIGKQLCANKKTDGEQYLVKKILSGDISDNIGACMVRSNYLQKYCNYKSSDEFKKCTPSIILKMVTNVESWQIIYSLLCQLRNGVNCSDTVLTIFKDLQFIENVRLIDFKMIPNELKNNMMHIFQQLV